MSHRIANSNGLRGLCVLALLLAVATGYAQTKSSCENVVAETKKLYDEGRFALAAKLLDLCVEKLPTEQRIGAYRLLAHAQLKDDHRDEAALSVREIFKIDRAYKADATQDELDYIELVAEVDKQVPQAKSKKWWWIGGSAGVLAGTVYYIVSRNNTEPDKPLAEPPALP